MRALKLAAAGGALALVAAFGSAVYFYERPTVLRVAVMRDSDDQAIFTAAAQDFAHERDWFGLSLSLSTRWRKARGSSTTSAPISPSCAAMSPCRPAARPS